MKKKTLIVLTCLSSLTFLIIFYLMLSDYFQYVDKKINSFFSSPGSFWILMEIFSFITEPLILIIIGIPLIYLIFLRKKRYKIIFPSLVMTSTLLMIYLIKQVVNRPRPTELVFTAFPSGHATMAVVFFGLIIYYTQKKKYLIGISILAILLISFNRIYLNVHWFSDILGGLSLGAFILFFSLLIKKKLENQTENKNSN